MEIDTGEDLDVEEEETQVAVEETRQIESSTTLADIPLIAESTGPTPIEALQGIGSEETVAPKPLALVLQAPVIIKGPLVGPGKIRDKVLEAEISFLQSLINVEPRYITSDERVSICTPYLETLKNDLYSN